MNGGLTSRSPDGGTRLQVGPLQSASIAPGLPGLRARTRQGSADWHSAPPHFQSNAWPLTAPFWPFFTARAMSTTGRLEFTSARVGWSPGGAGLPPYGRQRRCRPSLLMGTSAGGSSGSRSLRPARPSGVLEPELSVPVIWEQVRRHHLSSAGIAAPVGCGAGSPFDAQILQNSNAPDRRSGKPNLPKCGIIPDAFRGSVFLGSRIGT